MTGRPGPTAGREPTAARSGTARRLTTDLARTPSVFATVAGLWLALTPVFADHPASYPWWNDVATGITIASIGAVRVIAPHRTAALSLVNVLLGVWSVAAPFALDFADIPGAAWNDVIVGVLVIFFAGVSAFPRAAGPVRTEPSAPRRR